MGLQRVPPPSQQSSPAEPGKTAATMRLQDWDSGAAHRQCILSCHSTLQRTWDFTNQVAHFLESTTGSLQTPNRWSFPNKDQTGLDCRVPKNQKGKPQLEL